MKITTYSFIVSIAQSRNWVNFRKFAPLVGLLAILTGCGEKVLEKASSTIEKQVSPEVTPTTEKKSKPETSGEILATENIRKIESSDLYKQVEPMTVKLPEQGVNESTTSTSPSLKSFMSEQKKEIGYAVLKALSCVPENGASYKLTFRKGNPLVTVPSLEVCQSERIKIAETLANRGSTTFTDTILDLQQTNGSTGSNGIFVNLIQGPGFGENPFEEK